MTSLINRPKHTITAAAKSSQRNQYITDQNEGTIRALKRVWPMHTAAKAHSRHANARDIRFIACCGVTRPAMIRATPIKMAMLKIAEIS
jgi:hypothetical protein